MRRVLTLTLVLAAAVAVPTAADNPAWFGTPLPPPLSDPRQPIMKYDDVFAPIPTAFSHRPGRSDQLLDATALKADQKRIVGFSLESLNAGDKVWGRRAATPAFAHTIEWVVSEFKAAGLKDAKTLGSTTNNVAEWRGFLAALDLALEAGAEDVEIRADSQLVLRQFSGEYRMKAPHLAGFLEEARRKARRIPRLHVVHVPREENSEADALANAALDSARAAARPRK
jgi:ribonuclease HI